MIKYIRKCMPFTLLFLALLVLSNFYMVNGQAVNIPTISGLPSSVSVTKGDAVKLSGKIKCNNVIEKISVCVLGYYNGVDDTGKIISKNPNSTSYNLNKITIDSNLEAFPVNGVYTLKIWAKAENGEPVELGSIDLIIEEEETAVPVAENLPSNLTVKKGESVSLSGRITCEKDIEKVSVCVAGYYNGEDYTGKIISKNPNSTSYNLNKITIDSNLEAFPVNGVYTLKIWAKAENGEPVELGSIDLIIDEEKKIVPIAENLPSNLTVKKGESVSLSGRITCEKRIEKVSICVSGYYNGEDYTGRIISKYPNSKSYNLNEIVIESNLPAFSENGSYRLEIWAKAENGEATEVGSIELIIDEEKKIVPIAENLPSNLTVKKGESVSLSGRITCEKRIEKVSICVSGYYNGEDDTGKIISKNHNSTSYNLNEIVIESNLPAFSENGSYRLEIWANAENGEATEVGSIELIIDEEKKIVPIAENLPSNLTVKKGESVSLSGRITCEKRIEKVSICVSGYYNGEDYTGKIISKYPNSKSYNLNEIVIESNLPAFSENGSYTLEIWVNAEGKEAIKVGSINLSIIVDGNSLKVTVFKKYSSKKIAVPYANISLISDKGETISRGANYNGVYTFLNIATGHYTIDISQNGYEHISKDINVTNGNNFEQVEIPYIETGYNVEGYVYTKYSDEPIQKAQIYLDLNQNADWVEETDSNGYFCFKGVSNGSYTLTIRKQGFSDEQGNELVKWVQVNGDTNLGIYEIINLSGKSTAYGKVTDVFNNPIPGVHVEIENTYNAYSDTENNGVYNIYGVETNSYQNLIFSKEGFETGCLQNVKIDGKGADFILHSLPFNTLTGYIYDGSYSNFTTGQTTITLINSAGESTQYVAWGEIYSIDGLTDGKYTMKIQSDGYQSQTITVNVRYDFVNNVTVSSQNVILKKIPEIFSDVRGHWALNTIKYAKENNIISGFSDGTFRPNSKVTFGEFVTMLVKLDNPSIRGKKQNENWATPYAEYALSKTWIDDFSNSIINANITRETMASIVGRRLNAPEIIGYNKNQLASKFTDVNQIYDENLKYIYACVKEGIISGDTNGKFRPKDGLTRAEAITIICKLMDDSFKSNGEVFGEGTGNPQEYAEAEQIAIRTFYHYFGQNEPGVIPANTSVTPEVATEMLKNLSKDEYAFKPELGKGGCSWFVTEGNPYVGIDPDKNVDILVEVTKPSGSLVFDESKLLEMLNTEINNCRSEALTKFCNYNGLNENVPLQGKYNRAFSSKYGYLRRFAEARMWDKVGDLVRASSSKVGEVILQEGSDFSKQGSGKFAIVADASKVQVKGGITALTEIVKGKGVAGEPALVEAAEAMATKLKWAGTVRNVFRYGGKVLIVVGVAGDVYKVYVAEDKVKAVVESVGGWAGATAGAAAFAAWWTPADVAGPWAWAAHGVGTLISGGVGYWVGSGITRTIYELVIEE